MQISTRLLITGYAAVIVMMIVLSLTAMNSIGVADREVGRQVTQKLDKFNLAVELSALVRDRLQFMQAILLQDEDISDTDFWPGFNRLGDAYDDTRQQLIGELAPREREIMASIDRLESEIDDLNRQVAVLKLNGSHREARAVLSKEVRPKTAGLLAELAELSRVQHLEVQEALLLAGGNVEDKRTQIAVFSALAVLVSLAVAIAAVLNGRKLSSKLNDINNYLELKVYERTESLLDEKSQLIEDKNELTRMALTDSLTGLSNRMHMNQILHKEYARFERHNQRFGIIMLDIDHFKRINDNYGHDVGDQVLKRLAQIFENAIRTSDFVARWGGEEFLICCTTIEERDLLPIAETIRQLVANTEFDKVGQITASLGCAAIVKGESISELIKRSDVALYEAKNNGRNLTIVSEFTDLTLP